MKVPKDDLNYVYVWVGKNIKKYRKRLGITQRELAERCSFSETFIRNLENDSWQTLSLNSLYLISQKLGVSIIQLFDDLDPEKESK